MSYKEMPDDAIAGCIGLIVMLTAGIASIVGHFDGYVIGWATWLILFPIAFYLCARFLT